MAQHHDLAAAVWSQLFQFVIDSRRHIDRCLAEHGLTPGDAKAIRALDIERGQSMGELADEWMCDASTATWMVDRLVDRRLARRHESPHDRRRRVVTLTRKGAALKRSLESQLLEPPDSLLALSNEDLQQLRDATSMLST